jgi:hypothetical protein
VIYLFALLIAVAPPAACGFVSLAGYRGTLAGPDLAVSPGYLTTATAIGVTALTSFIPFPLGYPAGPVGWAVAALGELGLTAGRAALAVPGGELLRRPADRPRRAGDVRELNGRAAEPIHRVGG